MSDTLHDRIDAHLAKAKAATPGPWTDWGLGVVRSGSGAVVGKVLLEARYNSDAAHIAANNPATIEAFCAVATAAEAHIPACDVCTTPNECDAIECPFRDWRVALAALADALGRSK